MTEQTANATHRATPSGDARSLRIAVIGGGGIGKSWTALFLAGGHDVSVYDVAPDTEERVREGIAAFTPTLAALGYHCGDSLPQPGVCQHCQAFPPHFNAIRSWAVFTGPIRLAIHHLKYKRDVSLGVILVEPLVDMLLILNWDCDLIIPVPLGLARLKERGYNQSNLLARPLSLAVGIPYQSTGLIRVYETRSQVGLTFTQRRENVSGAFQALPESVSGRRVLVIDHVASSSATLDACATAPIEAGSKEVFALTLARAGYQTNYY